MKVLLIGHNNEDETPIKKLMKINFPKLLIVEAIEPEDLMEILTLDGPFSFIIMAIDHKNNKVIEIYKLINETLGLRPFIFIGSSNSIKSHVTSEILKYPLLNSVLKSPLLQHELLKAVKSSLEWVKNEEFEESILELNHSDLQRIRLRNLYLFEQIPYDVYLELTPKKFGKIISKNKPYSHQLIQNYSRKNVKYFHFKKDDHLHFLQNSIKNFIRIYETNSYERKKQVSLHLKTIFFIQDFIQTVTVTDEVIKLTKLFIESSKETIKSQENLSDLLDQISNNTHMTFAEHSLATAYVCESILFYMGWTADMSHDKLLLASILQDIYLKNDELIKIRSLNDPNLKLFSEAEQLEFQSHPLKAAQISTLFSGFSDVDFILNEHHEHPTGDGFPKGLNSLSLTTISCLFILSSNFVSRIARTKETSFTYKEIVGNMKRIFDTGNFKDPVAGLVKSFKKPK